MAYEPAILDPFNIQAGVPKWICGLRFIFLKQALITNGAGKALIDKVASECLH